MRDEQVTLLADGRVYSGWKRAEAQRGIEQCTGTFRLTLSDRGPSMAHLTPIAPGARCELMLGDTPVCTGFVDTIEGEVSAEAHELEIGGRDATCDLVDCSALPAQGQSQWRKLKVEQLAAEIARPFGINVLAEVDTGAALPSFALQEGETAFEAIERAARIRSLLLTTDGRGNLVITRAGERRVATELVLGGNVLRIRPTLDLRDRFSVYVVKGQAPGSDTFSGGLVAQMKAQASDPGVRRYRPSVIVADVPDLAASLAQRASWEANVRAARSTHIEVEVAGWRHAGGLWEPNALVKLRARPLQLDHELLVSAVQYSVSDAGKVAVLQLTRADAYSLLPLRAGEGTSTGPFWVMPKSAGGQ